MRPVEPHLVADVDLGAVRSALTDWSWLIGSDWSPILVSAAGDVFVVNSRGQVARLDTGGGELHPIAESLEAFEVACSDATTKRDWFLQPVVDALRAAGKSLAQDQCYGFTILPIFIEGSYAAHNRFMLNAIEHIRSTGDIHNQLKDVKAGDRVRIKVV